MHEAHNGQRRSASRARHSCARGRTARCGYRHYSARVMFRAAVPLKEKCTNMDSLLEYRNWIIDSPLPTWAERGFDTQHNRFRERLSWNGDPVNVAHRSMVQARQIYVFSHAARLGWFPEGAARAESAFHS